MIACKFADSYGLDDAMNLDGLCKFAQRLLVKVLSRLEWIDFDLCNR